MSLELLTTGKLCQITQLSPAKIREVLEQHQLRPSLTINGLPHYDAEAALTALRDAGRTPESPEAVLA